MRGQIGVLLVLLCSVISSIEVAADTYSFDSVDDLQAFELFHVTNNQLRAGQVYLEDLQYGDTQIDAQDDAGLLTRTQYTGDLEVILQYSSHALLQDDAYQALLGLFFLDNASAWENLAAYPHVTHKLHQSPDLNHSWFDFGDNLGFNQQAVISPRQPAGYLRLVRQQDQVQAAFWQQGRWQTISKQAVEYAGEVRIGVRAFANYNDVYAVALDQLLITHDQDRDGMNDALETYLGTQPAQADSDQDGVKDGVDLWPLDPQQQRLSPPRSRQGFTSQLHRVADQYILQVRNTTATAASPFVDLPGLKADAQVDVLSEGRQWVIQQRDQFIDEVALPAFASRVYRFNSADYQLPELHASIYPSTRTAWVLTGGQELPSDPTSLAMLPSVKAVQDWELDHADMVFGGGFGTRNQEIKAAVGYMYNQMLGFNPSQQEMWLRQRAEQMGLDYEDFLLHFQEDTVLEVRNAHHAQQTPLYGVPSIAGYTLYANHSGIGFNASSELAIDAWEGAADGGALYVYLFEPFDQLHLQLDSLVGRGELQVQYPSAVDMQGVVSQWNVLSIEDGTDNLQHSGVIRWQPPADWERAATYDNVQHQGVQMGHNLLQAGGAYYVVRLKWKHIEGRAPRLLGLSLKRWLQALVGKQYKIPGWDAVNDQDGNGYVDDSEFAQRSNPQASARFRYEARVVPLGSMWSESSSFCRTNVFNTNFHNAVADYYSQHWQAEQLSGAYNDDFFRHLGDDSFLIRSGGQLQEYAGRVQDEATQQAYREGFKITLAHIKAVTSSQWLSANISAENLFVKPERQTFVEILDAVLREDYLRPSLGLSGYFGVNKAWDNFALTAAGVKSVVMSHNRSGRVALQGNTQVNWQYDASSSLALYYLLNVPDKTFYQAWNSSFHYGSGNTFIAPSSFWKAGVPKNFAYQPSAMLQVDIGQPSLFIPSGKTAIKYMTKTQNPLSDYTVIGDSTDTVLRHTEIGVNGEVTVQPSYIYYFSQSEQEVVPDGPIEMVLARNYSNGLVLYRTDFLGGNIDFMQTESAVLQLPGTYRRVLADGSLSEPLTQLRLRGYEGAILQKATWQVPTLPNIPAVPLQGERPTTALGVRYDRLQAHAQQGEYDYQQCDVSAFWPVDRVQIGGRTQGKKEDVCKVQAQVDDGALKFLTKWPMNNTHMPLTSGAAWAQFRFPVAAGHEARTIEYEISWYKLFGSKPTNCRSTDFQDRQCVLDVSADWQQDIPAGLFLAWARPGDSDYYLTGPHDPIETIGYSGKRTFQVDVPAAYQDADEIVVTLLVYNQYTKACEKDDPQRCTPHENENLELHAVTLKTGKTFTPNKLPAMTHPRLLGAKAEWQRYWQPFDDLECMSSDKDMDWGAVFNAKNLWDRYTKGYMPCRESMPNALQDIADADFYLNPPESPVWQRNRALRVLFLLRQLKQCHTAGQVCDFDADDVQALQTAFIRAEMARFTSVRWDWGYQCFDLGTEPAMKFWSVFVDVFWDDLSVVDKSQIDAKLGGLIDCYLHQYDSKHWSIFNGNNWTPILAKAAMYWVLAYYHEDSRAPQVLRKLLESLWLHRDFYLADGAYQEGIVEYTNVSYSNLREINNLLLQGFGLPLSSVNWQRTAKTADWYLEFMAPDGAMVDFGDSWDKLGWYTLDPLHMLLWEEMIGQQAIGHAKLDACKVKDYFRNKWFAKGFEDPWSVQPSMARDWFSLVEQCKQQPAYQRVTLFSEALAGALRQYIPEHRPEVAQSEAKLQQMAQTYLAVSATPNDFPHRELDFAGVIWSAYGNRLLYDFGYGEIGKVAQGKPYLLSENGTQLYDNLPLGGNTLVVEDATQHGYSIGNYQNASINSSQIYGERGHIAPFQLGEFHGLHLDARDVYGAQDEALGWLRYFDRWLLSLGDGNFLVADAFAVKESRGQANVQEYWHTAAETTAVASCRYDHEDVQVMFESPQSVRLQPACARLQRYADANVVGRISAVSMQAGYFQLEPELLEYRNRTGGMTIRRRIRFLPEQHVSEDVRVFLLQAAPQANKLLPVQWQILNCEARQVCFELQLGDQVKQLRFAKVDGRYKWLTLIESPDRDGDGVANEQDAFPDDASEWLDTDQDGMGDNADRDDDNDGMPDVWEIRFALNPKDSSDAVLDLDGDGYSNLQEFYHQRDPLRNEEVIMGVFLPVLRQLLQ